MFRATMRPSSAELTVAVWPADQTATHKTEKYQCRVDTVSYADDGRIVTRNM